MNAITNFQPLYKQVYDTIVSRLSQGYWRAGDSLPSEFALAEELGVSQGTVRKALNHLVDKNILRRQQGKGTYVSEHTGESDLYRFFRYRESGGERLVPENRLISRKRRKIKKDECRRLSLDNTEYVSELTRVRSFDGKPLIYEVVIQPLSIFPGLDKITDLPNSLYGFYQSHFGVSIVEAHDELRAVALAAKIAAYLDLSAASPALMTERSSIDIDGRIVEISQAYCNTQDFVYSALLK